MPEATNSQNTIRDSVNPDIEPTFYMFGPPPEKWVQYTDIKHYLISLRDALGASTINSQPNHAENAAIQIFIYLFNAFKSILLLLEERYCESGNVLYRSLWETSLNLHWIAKDYPKRMGEYLNYSSVEFRSVVKSMGNDDSIALYDSSTARFQDEFKKKNARTGKSSLTDNFTNKSIFDRAQELGAPWDEEYHLIYKLTSMYAHGAPAAIIHAIKKSHLKCHEVEDNNQSCLIAVLCARLMLRNAITLESLKVIETTQSISASVVGLDLFLEEFERNKQSKASQ